MTRFWHWSGRAWILVALAFLGVSVLLTVHRYRSGANFQPVHVKITRDAIPVLPKCIVETKSPFGTAGSLEADPDVLGLYVSPFSRPVTEIIIRCDTSIDWSSINFEVRCGQFWVPPSQTLSIRTITETTNGGVRLLLIPLAKSMLGIPSQSCNWQGDIALLAVPASQAICILILLYSFYRLVGPYFRGSSRDRRSLDRPPLITTLVGDTLWAIASIALIHRIASEVQVVTLAANSLQFFVSLVVVAVVVALVLLMGRAITRFRRDDIGTIDKMAVTVLAVISLLKAIWVAHVDTVQLGDYDFYWSSAQAMANGDWNSLAVGSPLQSLMLGRSVPYFYPVAYMFGLSGLKWTNLCLQILTLAVGYLLVRRIVSPQVALLATPLAAIWPDSWFNVTSASHDIPALFLLAVVFLVFDILRVRMDSAPSVPLRVSNCLRIIILTVILGGLVGILNLQRDYGPFVIVSLFFWLLASLTATGDHWNVKWRRGLQWLVVLCVICVCVRQTSAVARQFLTSRIGQLPPTSTVAYLTACDSETTAKWDEMHPWRWLYFPAIPASQRNEFVIRKLAYEKLAVGTEFWNHLRKKNAVLAGSSFAMVHSHGGVEGKWFPKISVINWFDAKRLICGVASLGLMTGAVLRLMIGPLRLTSGELFPLIFCGFTYSVFIGFGEAVAIYDIFLGLPLSWFTAQVFLHVNEQSLSHAEQSQLGFQRLTRGGLGIAAAVLLHVVAGQVVTVINYHFMTPVTVISHPGEGDDRYIEPKVSTDRVSCSLRFADSALLTGGPCWTAADWTLSSTGRTPIHFFLTSDQRHRKRMTPDDLREYPVTYALYIDGAIVESGPLADLDSPCHCTAPLQSPSTNHRLRLELKSQGQWPVDSDCDEPVVALEYIY